MQEVPPVIIHLIISLIVTRDLNGRYRPNVCGRESILICFNFQTYWKGAMPAKFHNDPDTVEYDIMDQVKRL